MLKVEIVDAGITERSGTNARGNWSMRMQQGILHVGLFRYPVQLTLERTQAAYAVGAYLVADESFATDNYGNIVVKRLMLRPVAAAAPGPQARAV